jgi:RNA polymerase sigma-70 factor (ECF subfamily)
LFDDAPVADDAPGTSPELRAEAGDLRARLTAAVDRLPPKLRAVVMLRDVYDLPHEAIAAELNISESAAKVRLHRARRQLREDLFPLPAEEAARAV